MVADTFQWNGHPRTVPGPVTCTLTVVIFTGRLSVDILMFVMELSIHITDKHAETHTHTQCHIALMLQ